jgi:hypothetical protein
VLGDPGAGKSETIRRMLRNDNHIFQIWEPTAATTGLVAQYSDKSGYVPGRLGRMLIEASKNLNKYYTIVIDEFHKSSVIEMVNDELKHAISLKRYGGDRFIIAEDVFEFLDGNLKKDDSGNYMIPDNFGFIFISSKPDIIVRNGDIFDRLDIVQLTKDNRDQIKTANDLVNLAKNSDIEKSKLLD